MTALGIRSQPASSVDASHAGKLRPPASVATGTYDDGLSAFLSVRRRLFGIAYRMLGSAAEAEDIVQDVWVRWQTADRSVVRDAPAFLATTTTRLAINVIQSARSRRETYVGPCLPEPVDTNADPGLRAERDEALESAALILVEKLSPTERAAYVLREAFDYPYREIADILRLEEANTRQLVTRARRHVADGLRAPVSSAGQRRLLRRPSVRSSEAMSPASKASLRSRSSRYQIAAYWGALLDPQSTADSASPGSSPQWRSSSGRASPPPRLKLTVRRVCELAAISTNG